MATNQQTLRYKRSHFSTQLPLDYYYTPTHFWLAKEGSESWRIGLTKFSVRMLGEMVDHGFEVETESAIGVGQIIGWVEGFKAISDLYCVVNGKFIEANPLLKEEIEVINRDPYGKGWLYRATGTTDERSVDVYGYKAILDKTIDKMLEEQKGEEIE